MGSTLFRDSQALNSALAMLGTPQPQAFRSLNRVDPLDSVYFLVFTVFLLDDGSYVYAHSQLLLMCLVAYKYCTPPLPKR